MHLVAREVASALDADACFVYLYDEAAGEPSVLRATHGTPLDEMTRRAAPAHRRRDHRHRSGRGSGVRVAIAANADLDPRWKLSSRTCRSRSTIRFSQSRSSRASSWPALLNVRTREPREFRGPTRSSLLQTIASQVAQTIVHAQLYAQAQQRVAELEALARISEAVSESLYLEESLEAIVKTTMDAVHATGAALVLEDGRIAWPEGRAGSHAGPHAAALEAAPDRRARGRPRHAVHAGGEGAARLHRAPCRGRAGARAGRDARRPCPGDPPSRQEQPPDRRLAPAPAGTR